MRRTMFCGVLLASSALAEGVPPPPPVAVAPAQAAAAPVQPCGQLDEAAATRLAVARQTLQAGKGYAALAYLDALRSDAPEALLLRADANRRIGREDIAEALYLRLRAGCVAGFAYHGLGRIEHARGHLQAALGYLEQARALLPLSADLRNDLGVVYMQLGRFDEGQLAYMTAIELDPEDRRPLNNLIIAYARRGDIAAARRLAARVSMPTADFDALLARIGPPASPPAPSTPTPGEPHETP